jgi:hypothetical protein
MASSTEQDLGQAIDARIAERQAREYLERHRIPDPFPPAADTFEFGAMLTHERQRQERVAAAEAEEARRRREREAAEAERGRLYAENAPRREAARVELAQLEPALAVLEESADSMRTRRLELRAEIERHAR